MLSQAGWRTPFRTHLSSTRDWQQQACHKRHAQRVMHALHRILAAVRQELGDKQQPDKPADGSKHTEHTQDMVMAELIAAAAGPGPSLVVMNT